MAAPATATGMAMARVLVLLPLLLLAEEVDVEDVVVDVVGDEFVVWVAVRKESAAVGVVALAAIDSEGDAFPPAWDVLPLLPLLSVPSQLP